MNEVARLATFSLIALLGACATTPHAEYDTDRMFSIKMIAVNVPKTHAALR